MEPMGQCPVCDHKIAPTCETCPQCGNTDWWRKTGEHGVQPAFFRCPDCGHKENSRKCSRCNGKGQVEEEVEWFEWVDTRDAGKKFRDHPQNLLYFGWK